MKCDISGCDREGVHRFQAAGRLVCNDHTSSVKTSSSDVPVKESTVDNFTAKSNAFENFLTSCKSASASKKKRSVNINASKTKSALLSTTSNSTKANLQTAARNASSSNNTIHQASTACKKEYDGVRVTTKSIEQSAKEASDDDSVSAESPSEDAPVVSPELEEQTERNVLRQKRKVTGTAEEAAAPVIKRRRKKSTSIILSNIPISTTKAAALSIHDSDSDQSEFCPNSSTSTSTDSDENLSRSSSHTSRIEFKSSKEVNAEMESFCALFKQDHPPPRRSALARPRAVRVDPAAQVIMAPISHTKQTVTMKNKSDPVNVTSEARVREFPNEGLCVDRATKELYCERCNDVIALKRTSIVSHLGSSKHKRRTLLCCSEAKRLAHYQSIITNLLPGRTNSATVGDSVPATTTTSNTNAPTLSPETLYRLRVCYVFLIEALTMSLLESPANELRRLLEHQQFSLPERNVRDLTPIVLQQENEATINQIITSKAASFSFDATCDVAECFAVVVRFVQHHTIHHRALHFKLLQKSMTGVEIFRALLDLLFTIPDLPKDTWHYACRDGCSANTNAMEHMLAGSAHLVDTICLSHAVNVAGKRFEDTCPRLFKLISVWAAILNSTAKFGLEFFQLTGETAKRNSRVRWFCFVEVGLQLGEHLDTLRNIAENGDLGADKLRAKLLKLLTNHHHDILLEHAVFKDAAMLLVRLCYAMERDTFTAPFAMQGLEFVLHKAEGFTSKNTNTLRACLPTVASVVNALSPNDPGAQNANLLRCSLKIAEPYTKLQQDVNCRLEHTLMTMRVCRLWSYHWVAQKPLPSLQEELDTMVHHLPYIAPHANELLEELPLYLARAVQRVEQAPPEPGRDVVDDNWLFWAAQSIVLPAWYQCCMELALVMTSSASVERVFSMYTSVFTDENTRALEDRREATVLLRYNRAKQQAEEKREADLAEGV